jgi:hypothetical protein
MTGFRVYDSLKKIENNNNNSNNNIIIMVLFFFFFGVFGSLLRLHPKKHLISLCLFCTQRKKWKVQTSYIQSSETNLVIPECQAKCQQKKKPALQSYIKFGCIKVCFGTLIHSLHVPSI